MFQKRHMEVLALALQRTQPDPNQPERLCQWEIVQAEIRDMLLQSNPRFDVARFERACERGANVRKRSA
jgi:hypothetical protein